MQNPKQIFASTLKYLRYKHHFSQEKLVIQMQIRGSTILFASPIDAFVFPTAVGPAKIISGFFIYTILLNFFSNSRFVMAMIVGLPWGQ